MAYPEHKKETGHKKEKVEEEETVDIESEEETAKAAQKTTKPKVDKEESERLRKFNEELRSRKAPQPKAK